MNTNKKKIEYFFNYFYSMIITFYLIIYDMTLKKKIMIGILLNYELLDI